MTTTVIVKANHWAVEIDHIDVSEGHELSRRSEIVPLGEERMAHIWEGREIRIREIKNEIKETKE